MLLKPLKTLAAASLLSLAALAPLAKADEGPLKVFILCGQSNMQGHAHISTFGVIGMDPETAPMLQDMVDGGVYPNRYQPGGYDDYSKLLAQFIRDVRKDLSAPELPFVIGVMGAGGPTDLYGPKKKRYQGMHQYFRDAMAAPAALPEFKDNVTAVLTEKYWDMELDALREREGDIKRELKELQKQVKEGELSKEALDAKKEALYSENFTERELKILQEGASNFEFHYLGSAKILGQIGKAFAEANLDLLQK